ncbi:hypothetical protein BsWGS_03091 [Bradybaena similaris]
MQFQHGLFGCFDNCGLCVITYFAPCYTFGKIAEATGDSCIVYGLLFLIPVANFILHIMKRGQIREMKGIDGSLVSDILNVCCCPWCALVQEAQEVESPGGHHMARC